MGLHGISQLIDAFNGSIGSAVKADAVIGAADVVVNGGRNADDVDAKLAQGLCATEGAVAADGNDAVQSQELAGGSSLALTFLGHKFLTAGSIEDGAALIDGTGNALLVQLNNITADQTVPATADTVNFYAMETRSSDNTADSSIHAGCVATAGKDTDSFHIHKDSSPSFFVFRFYCTE